MVEKPGGFPDFPERCGESVPIGAGGGGSSLLWSPLVALFSQWNVDAPAWDAKLMTGRFWSRAVCGSCLLGGSVMIGFAHSVAWWRKLCVVESVS